MPALTREIAQLERRLAYSAARSDIECTLVCVFIEHNQRNVGKDHGDSILNHLTPNPNEPQTKPAPKSLWFDLGSNERDTEIVTEAVKYLEAFDLLEHLPGHADIVRVKDLTKEVLGAAQ